jgi:predicted MFS family arabinose efflux permease
VPVAFGMGLFLIPVFSITRQSLSVMVPEKHRRAAFSIDNVFSELSFIVGPAIGILLVTQAGAAAALAAIGACEVIAGFALLWLNPPTRSETQADGDGRAVPWMSLQIGFLFLIAVGTVFALIAADLGIVSTLEEAGDTGAIALVYGLWGGASLVGGLLYGAANASVRPTYLLLGLGLTAIPVGLADSVLTLSLAIIPTGFLCAPTMTASTEWIARLTPEERRGEAMGWHGSSFTAGGALAAPSIGAAIVAVGLLSFAAGTIAQPRFGEIDRAEGALRGALNDLHAARSIFGGHKTAAERLIGQALHELQEAKGFAATHGH